MPSNTDFGTGIGSIRVLKIATLCCERLALGVKRTKFRTQGVSCFGGK